jgi:hypothetical protein
MNANELELCVSCNCETIYTKNTNIDYRYCYIEGAGQLCKDCYDKIYRIKDVTPVI